MSAVRYEVDGGVATARLNRPEALNALDPGMMAGLRDAAEAASGDPAVKVLVISGEGRAFCAGADMLHLEEVLKENRRYFAFVRELNDTLLAIEECPVTTIAVVHDLALAGGLELLLSCDFAIAAEDARIGDQHANFGLMPGGGSTQRLPRRVGVQRAKELLFGGGWISGSRAEEIGLVLRAVPRDALDEATMDLAGQMVSKSKSCTAYTKRAVQRGIHLSTRDGLQQEAHALFEYFSSSASPQVGLRAFRDRTKPEFAE